MTERLTFENFEFIDLSHGLNAKVPTWKGGCGFRSEIKLDYEDGKAISFRVQKLSMHAGIGTHMDAPSHAFRHGLSIADLELKDLFSPGVMIQAPKDINGTFSFTKKHILDFEQQYGTIPEGACVLFHSGWDIYWKEPENYHNHFLFPSVHKEVAQLLVDRGVSGLGIDTLSPDRPKEGYSVHQIMLGSGKYIIENAAHLEKLPPTGFMVIALPIKVEGGTEAPIRLVALIPKQSQ